MITLRQLYYFGLFIWAFVFAKNYFSEWNRLKRFIGEHKGDIGRYNHNDNSYASYAKVENLKYKELFNHHGSWENSLQLKFSSNSDDPFHMKVINFYKNKLKDYKNHSFMLRIQTNPWKFNAHFDCFDNTLLMVYGSKLILMFNLEDNYNLEKTFLEEIKNLNIKKVEEKLINMKKVYQKKLINQGESVFIPKRMYHLTENVGKTKGNIFINIEKHSQDFPNCEENFDLLWPKQQQICKNNNCIY